MIILIVEDEMMVSMLLEDMLADMGHEVIGPAKSVSAAASLVASGGFDLAILDVNLDGKSSYGIAQQLKEQGVPFIFATGYGNAIAPEWSSIDILQKPFRSSDLERCIQSALNKKAGISRTGG